MRVGLRNVTKGAKYQSAGAEVVMFDLSDPATFPAALENISRVFFVLPFMAKPRPSGDAFIAACEDARVECFVKLSGDAADKTSDIPMISAVCICVFLSFLIFLSYMG